MKFKLLMSPSFPKINILSILFLAAQQDPRKFPASTAVAVLAFPSSYLKVPSVKTVAARLFALHCKYTIILKYPSIAPRISTCKGSLRSWRDFARECFCCSSKAVNTSGEAVRGLVKSRVEFPPAQIRWVF